MKNMVKTCHALVIECLLKYSRGVTTEKEDKHGVTRTNTYYPYHPAAGSDTSEFKNVTSAMFGFTLASMYHFVGTEESLWDLKLKGKNYPITKLWPYNTILRYLNFVKNFKQHRNLMFANYEDAGGKYHGSSEDTDGDGDGDGEDGGDASGGSPAASSSEDEDNVFAQM